MAVPNGPEMAAWEFGVARAVCCVGAVNGSMRNVSW